MKLFKNQKGFSDVVTVAILAGMIGSIFIGGVFVWKEIDRQNTLSNLVGGLSFNREIELEQNRNTYEAIRKAETNDVYANKELYQLVNEACSEDRVCSKSLCTAEECLLQDFDSNYESYWVHGNMVLEGWYKLTSRATLGDGVTGCDTFIVSNGPVPVMDAYKHRLEEGEKSGNNFYLDEESNNPNINISLEELDEESKNRLLNSSENNPVDLFLFQYPNLGPRGTCTAMVKIFEVR